jgi:hypothetical protein
MKVLYSINRLTNCTIDAHHYVFVEKYKIYVIVQFGVCGISTCILCSVYYTPCLNMFEILYLYALQIAWLIQKHAACSSVSNLLQDQRSNSIEFLPLCSSGYHT